VRVRSITSRWLPDATNTLASPKFCSRVKFDRSVALVAKARQMRPTLEIEMPLCRAMLRVLHCVAAGGWLSNV
jgi:hypothetical protein